MTATPCIDLIDYGGGNTGSVIRCLKRLELDFNLVNAENPPSGNRPLLLPGVGAFGAVMESLQRDGLDREVRRLVESGTPFLGICLGLQVLFESSEETPGVPGLSLLPGRVVRYRSGKIPQIGWNRIETPNGSGWPAGHVYFVNSYHAAPADPADILYTADYGGPFCAAVHRNNITAFQFHPEKSGAFGHDLLRRWADAL